MKFILPLVTTILAAVGWLKPQKPNKSLKIAMVGLVIASGCIQVWIEIKQSQDRETLRYTGSLVSDESHASSNIIQFGPSGTGFKLGQGTNVSVLNTLLKGTWIEQDTKLLQENSLIISCKDNRLFVTATIRGSDGLLIAELIDNEWKVNPRHAFDRNFSGDALEVRDDRGDVVLQVELLSDHVSYQGRFWDSLGYGFAIIQSPGHPGSLFEIIQPSSKKESFRHPIEPMFRYPSDGHLGERIVR